MFICETEDFFQDVFFTSNSICLAEDQAFYEGIHDAKLALHANTFLEKNFETPHPTLESSFAFFDLHLSTREIDALNCLKVEIFDFEVVFAKSDAIYMQSLKLLNRIIDHNPQLKHCNLHTIAKSISRISTAIIVNSEYDDAKINIITSPPKNVDLYWHIDKTHQEIINGEILYTNETLNFPSHANINIPQHETYVITLKGETTLYYPTDTDKRKDFFELSKDEFSSFGYNTSILDPNSRKWNNAINAHNLEKPSYGEASVHIAGLHFGTIHASPTSKNGRLILTIMPDKISAIKQLQRSLEY